MSFYPIRCTGTYVMQEKPLLPLYARKRFSLNKHLVLPKGTLPKTTASAPKPAPAQTKPKGTMPKGFTPESASKPKPAETKNAPTNMAQALEKAYENWPMTSTADYKAKTPGYTPAPNRYFARQHGVVGKTTTKDWNIQKKAVTGYTAASDQYFATKQRLAYHPADKTFNGYGLKANGSAQQAPPPPPPPPKVETFTSTCTSKTLKALCQKVSMLNLHQNQNLHQHLHKQNHKALYQKDLSAGWYASLCFVAKY